MIDVDLPALVLIAGPALEERVLARVAAAGYAGARRSHGYLFQRLLDGEPTIGELASALGITQQGASKVVGEVERLGFVERVETADRRVHRIRLTRAGRDVVDLARAERAAIEEELVAMVGERDRRAASRALVALVEIAGLGDAIRDRAVPPSANE